MKEKKFNYCQCGGPTQTETYGKICAFCFKLKQKQDQSRMAKKIEEIKKETKETSESYSIGTAVNHKFENFLNNPVFLYQGKDCTEDEWPDSEGKNKLTRTPRD